MTKEQIKAEIEKLREEVKKAEAHKDYAKVNALRYQIRLYKKG